MNTPADKASTAQELHDALKPLVARLASAMTKLEHAGTADVPPALLKELAGICSAIREAAEPTPPSATTEKALQGAWPRDLNTEGTPERVWGGDPKGLRHG